MTLTPASKPTKRPTKTKQEIADANENWLKLMNAQANVHRDNLDPRLYRKSTKVTLISPSTLSNKL